MELPQAAKDLIDSAPLAHLTTLNGDGSPDVTMCWVGVDDGEIVLGTLNDQRKLQNARRDPRVALSIHTDELNDWGMTKYMVVQGTARVVEGGAPELLQHLAHSYLGPDVKFPPMPDPPPGYVTRIKADRIKGIGPWSDG